MKGNAFRISRTRDSTEPESIVRTLSHEGHEEEMTVDKKWHPLREQMHSFCGLE